MSWGFEPEHCLGGDQLVPPTLRGLSLSNSSSLGALWVYILEDTPSGSSAIRWIRQNSQCLKIKRFSASLKGTVARESFFDRRPFLQKMTTQYLIFFYMSLDFGQDMTKFFLKI